MRLLVAQGRKISEMVLGMEAIDTRLTAHDIKPDTNFPFVGILNPKPGQRHHDGNQSKYDCYIRLIAFVNRDVNLL